MTKLWGVTAFVLSLAMVSCGDLRNNTEVFESSGVLVELDSGVEVVSLEESKDLCQKHFCEPNYIYHANFGKKKPKPKPSPSVRPSPGPNPSPSPRPSPKPSPKPSPSPSPALEQVDYSKAILGLDEAWKTTLGSREIIVAVVDTGVSIKHKDLANNIWVNKPELKGVAGRDDDGNGYIDDVYGFDFANDRPNGIDDNDHGTHVAGIIGAELNGLGTVGVSPKVRIMPLKFLDARGSGTAESAIKAIDYAIANGAHVISNSWGGGSRSEMLNDAIQRAIKKGILVVAAAGNWADDNDLTPSYPAAYDGVISVASSDEKDGLSSFSNYGRYSVAVVAPGSKIYSTIRNDRYDFMDGTSMAAPQVSGALALALSLGKSLTADQMKEKLCSSSRKILLSRVRCGRMDVAEFIRAVGF